MSRRSAASGAPTRSRPAMPSGRSRAATPVKRAGPAQRLPAVARHALTALATCVTVALVAATRAGWDPMHAWNRAFADVSLLLLVITLAVGPIGRLWPRAARLTLWRGELGVWSVVAAVGHVAIVMTGWVEWDAFRLFYSVNPFKRDWALDQGFALGNLLGIVALFYGVVLAATSNEASIHLLGGSAWKFVQQGAYVLYALAALHTAYFLFFHFVTFHRPPPPANWMGGPFLALAAALFILQTAALVATVRRRRAAADGAAPVPADSD
jgi:methionine sulfoxide reductase heme-binding subunit